MKSLNTDANKRFYERKPKGFDPGLQCLAGVFAWTMVVKFFLSAAAHTHNRAWILLALLGDFIGVAILFLISMIVWLRRKDATHPPRSWAVLLAVVWASSSSAVWLWTFAANQFGPTPIHSSSFHNGGDEINRKTFSVSLPDKWPLCYRCWIRNGYLWCS
jgi:hypothetical protein